MHCESHGSQWLCLDFLLIIFCCFLCKVAMFGGGMGSPILRDLTRIAETADTSSRDGLTYLLAGSFWNCFLYFSSHDVGLVRYYFLYGFVEPM